MEGKISGIQDTLDLFADIRDGENKNDYITEEDIISESLKLLSKIDGNPLLYYCILKTVLTKKNLLTDVNKKEISNILDIKPVIKEKIVYREKIVYKEKKPKRLYDDY